MAKTVAFYTLGCKVNQYETEAFREAFEQAGYTCVAFDEAADVYVINTCTVTNMSDRKSRQMLRRAKRQNPEALVVAVGCYAQTAPGALEEMGIDLVVGTDRRTQLVALVEERTRQTVVSDIMKVRSFEEMKVNHYSERTRAYVKIQEGCDRFCSYCIIPYARGPVRSRRPELVLDEAARLADAGYTELVLTGIHVASYGKDLGDTSLLALLRQVHEVPGLRRLRLSSIDPMAFTDEFIEAAAAMSRLCSHFHISLQSGCGETLRRMNRRYTPEVYAEVVEKLRRAMPDVAITTDIITGFPGETEEEFAQSMAFARRIGFAQTHVFPYSERTGTPAASMAGSVPPPVREERAKQMIALGEESRQRFLQAHVGKALEVLFEQQTADGRWEGLTDNYLRVVAASGEDLAKAYRTVTCVAVENDCLIGEQR